MQSVRDQIINAMTEPALRNRLRSEGETVQAPSPRRTAATLEQSARSGTAHPRYRMT